LNRAEYANAVRDLLELPIDSTSLLPGDDSSEGFDNMASTLSVSPALMQAYVTAAAKISRLALGDPTISTDLTTYQAPRGLSQATQREGLPLGTRGGILVTHVFPLDAEYEFRVGRAGAGFFGLPAVGVEDDVEITIDGQRVQTVGRTPPRGGIKLKVPAGPACRRRGGHPQIERAWRGRSVRRAGQHRRRQHPWHQRPDQRHRPRRHAKPETHLRLQTCGGDRRAPVCAADLVVARPRAPCGGL
jgi:hypothetical protein